MSRQSLVRASTILLILFVTSRVLGFVREQIIAALLGATARADAFVVAATIPFTLSYIIGTSTGNAFLPVYTGRLQQQEGQAGCLAAVFFCLIGAGTAALTIPGLVFAPQVVDVLAPGFGGPVRDLAVFLTRLMMPATFFLTMGFVAKAALNAHREFTVPAVAPVLQNVVFIVPVFFLARWQEAGLAFCTLVGAIVFHLVNIPSLRRHGIYHYPRFGLRDPDLKKVLLLSVPVTLTALAGKGYVFVDRLLASHLAEGSIAALNFANRIRELPYGMFVAAVSTVLFPALASAASERDLRSLCRHTDTGLRLVALVTFPAAAAMLVLDVPIVRLLFERGAFDAGATLATASALSSYSLSVVALSASSVLTYTFLSLQNGMVPLLAGLVGLAVNVAVDLILIGPMGHSGLALGNTVGTFVTAIFLVAALARRVPGMEWSGLVVALIRITLATAIFTVLMHGGARVGGLDAPDLSLGRQLLGLVLAVVPAGAAYLFLLRLLGLGKMLQLWR